MIVLDYKKIDVPQTNASSAVAYTTVRDCLMWFMPIGNRMEDDTTIGVYAESIFTDTDGGIANVWIYHSNANRSTPNQLNGPGGSGNSLLVFVPAGNRIITTVGDSSDRIGGTLYVLELP